jgi:LAO/AO transport system kinase
VICTVATTGGGIDDLVEAIDSHRTYLDANGLLEAKRIDALKNRTRMIAEQKLREIFFENGYIQDRLNATLNDVISGKISPYQAADALVTPFKRDINKAKGDAR